jgi:hypothetical protein
VAQNKEKSGFLLYHDASLTTFWTCSRKMGLELNGTHFNLAACLGRLSAKDLNFGIALYLIAKIVQLK